MNKKIEHPDNVYTQQVKKLLDKVSPVDGRSPSLYADAKNYFSLTPSLISHIRELEAKRQSALTRETSAVDIGELQQHIQQSKQKLEDERLARIARVNEVSRHIIELCEGDSYEETQTQSARFLGTLMLLTQGPATGFARLHQRLKPLYKAVLLLRLVDKLLQDETTSHPYLALYRPSLARMSGDEHWQKKWQTELAIPLISSALLQDIGLQHNDAQAILLGEKRNLDEFRLLEESQRKQLLKLNYLHTMSYLKRGLGQPVYEGDNTEEQHRFDKTHEAANQFREKLMYDAFVSKTGLGELLKIPQIYVSIILSTKHDYTRKELAKGYLLIEQLAKKGGLNTKLAQAFMKIVGFFPQGFGITFIPVNERGEEKKQFEYAIVNQLNPKNPGEPHCRVVSRNLNFVTSGGDEVIEKGRNLFFPANQKKLMRIGRDRISEIMSQLQSNFNDKSVDGLAPPYWEPADYFAEKKHQNLWKRGPK
ncbi:hypothetical protein IT774_05825 [Salinimonas marina]|uniref:Uncharacterized protein n=1 Tax=Salinimonas marina TaxID=2785918 RepID=A0A7S9DZ86_9ALTE|nr:hypothetical protein [Salinimonas marina]QPG06669.1 hypothetical protein IT774_05825 [Salinimonas marina]